MSCVVNFYITKKIKIFVQIELCNIAHIKYIHYECEQRWYVHLVCIVTYENIPSETLRQISR